MIYTWIFNPILTIHIVIVSIGLVLAFYMIPLGFRASRIADGKRILVSGSLKEGRMAFSLKVILVSIALGLVFPTLRSLFRGYFTLRMYLDWIIVCLVIGLLVVLMERMGRRFLPDGERRHRVLGGVTMILYAIALVTSSITYLLLYVVYPPSEH